MFLESRSQCLSTQNFFDLQDSVVHNVKTVSFLQVSTLFDQFLELIKSRDYGTVFQIALKSLPLILDECHDILE